jgi:hypothetical protein
VATCPSCSLIIRVIYDYVRLWIIGSYAKDLTQGEDSWILKTTTTTRMQLRQRH